MTDIFKEMHDLYMADKQGLRTMITIDDVIQWRRQFGDLLSCDENQRLFADLALSQQEEIQRLRAQLDKWRKGQNTITRSHYLGEIERLRAANKDALAWFEDLKVEFDKVRRERDEYAGALAYYGNSCAIYHDGRVRLYAIDTLEKYTSALKSDNSKP